MEESGEAQTKSPLYAYSPKQYLDAVEEVTSETSGNREGETLPFPVAAEEPGNWEGYAAYWGEENCLQVQEEDMVSYLVVSPTDTQ